MPTCRRPRYTPRADPSIKLEALNANTAPHLRSGRFRASDKLIASLASPSYRDRRGYLTLVELKTRGLDKVYPSDVIELSAQRVAITAATGEAVHEEAYVLVQGPKGQRRRAHRVKLLTEAQVVALAERREALLSGTTQARRTCINGICDPCAFVSPCRGSR